ncbi:ARM repeat-containing protein [Vararia minispora EC-137]|uniref:ARM repeat-containing protein n=1 Tax=Vararia minispora EC-137 TaxID=1314806 RepID=A0ACB8QDU3_9AGAM|nr:ARM repeat-containing protein [Vararia minispora EC-137]
MVAPKKRTAPPSKAGPVKKKAHIEVGVSTPTSKNKRAKPVVQHESESEEDDDNTEDDGGDFGNEDGDEDGAEVGENEPSTDSTKAIKNLNATRESHKARRALLEQRKAAKPHASLLADAKSAWTLARQKNAPKAERQKHIAALMDIIRGKVQDIVFKHDASRIVQTVVKRGDEQSRNEIAAELKGRYCELAQNKYSKFLVTKIARLCPAYRSIIILEFKGHIRRLLLHREASRVLADVYELHANAYERSLLVRDLYGRETALFSNHSEDKGRIRAGLTGVLEDLDSEKKRRVLAAVRESLDAIFNNSDKGTVRHAIVHRALWEYLSALNDFADEAESDKLRREMLEGCQDLLAEMVHTKDGSRAVREFLAQGTAKDRKQILKVLKPYIETMAKDDEAQLVLFTALDVTDDTKLLAKSVVGPITESATNLQETAAGRRALLYLLTPRAKRHFTPALIASLAETDSARERTSKKDAGTRAAEVRAAASPSLLAWVTRDGAAASRETAGSLVVLDVMLEADGGTQLSHHKTAAMETLLQPLAAPYPSEEPSMPHVVDLPHSARMYKKLLHGGHFNLTTKTLERAERFSAKTFAEAFVRIVGREPTLAIAGDGGAYLVATLLERLGDDSDEVVRNEVRGWFKGFNFEGRDSDAKSSQVLIERLRAL